ncbi:MAG TPA: class I SAM-dependent methyltransferase [bacterium]
MADPAGVAKFSGSVPETYEKLFVPLIFEFYAADMAARAKACQPKRLLEIAAGTGAVTRQLAAVLPADTVIVATDLNPPMLAIAQAAGTKRPVEWKQADAMQLPFEDASFDAVVCQFGVMFLPDKGKAFAGMRRVLRPGGTLLFSAWDRIEENHFTDVVMRSLAQTFPKDPPSFMYKAPHGYFDIPQIKRDVTAGGFGSPEVVTLAGVSRAPSAMHAATAICQGSPLRAEIEARGAPGLEAATQAAADALAKQYGSGAIEAKMQAHVVTVRK